MTRLAIGVMALLFLAACSTTAVEIDQENTALKVKATTQIPLIDDLDMLMEDTRSRVEKVCRFNQAHKNLNIKKIGEIVGVTKGILGLFPVHSYTWSGTCSKNPVISQ